MTESPTNVIVTVPPHPSLAVTLLVSGKGTALEQLTVRLDGQLMVGPLVSFTVIVCAQISLLPHSSVAR